MKNTFNIMAIFALLFFAACQEDEYAAPDSLSDVSWYSSIKSSEIQAVNQGYYMSFIDASVNATSHSWTIEEGNNFLNPGFSVSEKEDSLLPLYINKEVGLSVTEPTIHVLFNNAGLNKVRLYNTFNEKVSYKGTFPLEAQKEGDKWVIDTTFVIDVYADIEPSYIIKKIDENGLEQELFRFNSGDDIPTDTALWNKIIIESGEALSFVDITTAGRPSDRWWTLEGASFADGTAASDSVRIPSYYNMGEFSGQIRGIRKGDYPDAETLVQMPVIIEVIQSTKPLVAVNSPKTLMDESIDITISGAVQPFSDQEAFFTVTVNNTEAGVVDKKINVSLAKRGSVSNVINLTLDEPIYNTDVVTVAYDNTGSEIISVDERQLESFDAITVINYFPGNHLDSDWAGYEIYNGNWKTGFCNKYWVGANGSESEPIFARTTDKFFSGVASMSYTGRGGVVDKTLQGGAFAGQLTEAGLYRVSLKVFVDPATTMSTFRTTVASPWTILYWNFSSLPKGKWVTMTQDVSFNAVPNVKFNIQVKPGDNTGVTGDQLFYVDDITFIPLQVRP
ncbi:hypothetical protein [Labilibacter marinus]|uniref:hypothetical protein n=1 Tax=Labilibacter marinus TaxID=1477105 RepID=UPI00094F94A7|nr:hypothetical protein [Labilibacter marinus]